MRIIFLCGSLEPGRDGVGDYSRRLAGELIRQGHQASVVALNDKYLQEETIESIQADELQEVSTLRLSNQLSWKKRIERASEFISLINPDWLSLQYVAFAFQKKGMPFGLPKLLNQLSEGKNLHIMFHELWVGVEANAPRKMVWWGHIQQTLIKSLLNRTKPDIIHTQSKLYQHMLSTLGYNADLVPLFGNIPVRATKKDSNHRNDTNTLSFVIFGGIHENCLINEFALEASSFSRSRAMKLKFIFLGRNGKLLDEWVNILTKEGFTVEIIGEQPVEKISEVLINSVFGLTSTPLLLTDKSGSIAAMAEHGMRVICIRREWKTRYKVNVSDNSIVQYTVGNAEDIFNNYDKPNKHINSLSSITSYLINTLQNPTIVK